MASGDYSPQHVQSAQFIVDSVRENCASFSAETLEIVMASFEDVLPTGSDEERAAERQRELEQREAEKLERARKVVAADSLPLSDVFRRPPTGRVVSAGFIDREDDLGRIDIDDWDVYRGNLRVLTSSAPSREQYADGERRKLVYVTTIDGDGSVTQRRVAALQVGRAYRFGLFPNRDEIAIQTLEEDGETSKLQRWSVSGAELIEEHRGWWPPWASRRRNIEQAFRAVTADGNLFYVSTVPTAKNQTAVRWQEVAPNGRLVASGQSQRSGEKHSLRDWFRTVDGELGLVVAADTSGEAGIAGDLSNPVEFSKDGVTLRGVVGSNLRVLLLDGDSGLSWQSPALERLIVWLNLSELMQDKSIATLEKIGDVQQSAAIEFGELLNAVTYSLAGRRREAVMATPDGIAALLRNSAKRLEHPQLHGDWLHEFGSDGNSRFTHLAAAARHLGGRFVMGSANESGQLSLLLQGKRDYIVTLNERREPVSYTEIEMPADVPPMLLLADNGGSWLVSIGRGGGDQQRLWTARLRP